MSRIYYLILVLMLGFSFPACDSGGDGDGDGDSDGDVDGDGDSDGDADGDPTCDDGEMNGDETDTDCGGSCGPCADGGVCVVAGDCASGVCEGGLCQAPACDDGVMNGDETDVDCGGSCGATCDLGASCESADDCASGYCSDDGECVIYESCQAILEGGASTGDGDYNIDTDLEGPNVPFEVYCDMTTDGGGWTAIDANLVINTTSDAAGEAYRLTRTDINDNGLCNVEDGGPMEGHGRTGVFCRYDFNVGFEFNTLRTGPDPEDDAVVIEVEAGGAGNTSDLTRDDADWGARSCGSAGDVRFGTTTHHNGALSLGMFRGIASCNDSNQHVDGYQWVWADDETHSTGGTVLRLEFQENGGQDEGWRWESGTIYVRNEIEIVGALEAGDPGMWADDTVAESCAAYRNATGFYVDATEDGFYAIQPDPDADPVEVYCDMTTDGGGWTLVIDWDREHDGDTLGIFQELMTEEVNDMTEWMQSSGYIQWSDLDLPHNDVMDWVVPVTVPNTGDVRFGLHSYHYSMDDSSVWFYVTTADDEELNLRCWDDHGRAGGSWGARFPWTAEEEAYMPEYDCGVPGSGTWTWNRTDVYELEAEVASFNFTAMASDGGHGDYSRLYWFEVWVR